MADADFTVRGRHVAQADVAPGMHDMAARVRNLMALQQGHGLQLPLGGRFFDIVVTASCPEAYAVVDLMDEVQHVSGERPDACGPVIEDPERNWLVWLVPPGTSESWAPHRYGACLGRPYELAPAEALPVDSAELAAVRRQPESSVHVEFVADRPVQPQ
ncbi:hypothetical protein [Streptomyces sp. Tue6028]|uniref:hypothetical protein n=1 Tax=Streptomyces sp. Tue6028 TaxID=2036037 RepID=UPI003D7385A3